MQTLAQKLINLREKQTVDRLPSAIFGSIHTLNQSLDNRRRVRIGIWPCISDDDPELAMGVFTILAFLLERWSEIRVYRLFMRPKGSPDNYQWEIEHSQFSVDDWELDGLDENVAIWGTLDHNENQWTLTVNLENDLQERIEQTLTYHADTLTNLVNKLPSVAQDIASNTNSIDTEIDAYTGTSASDIAVKILLKSMFKWQVNLFLTLWGQPNRTELEDIINTTSSVNDEFGEWCLSNAIAHALLPGYGEEIGDTAQYAAFKVLNNQPQKSIFPAIYLSYALFRQGDKIQEAYSLLENAIKTHSDNATGYLLLANLYQRGRQFTQAIKTYQNAIESQVVNWLLLQRYAQLLNLLSDYNGEYVLIEQEDLDNNEATAWEAITAYEDAIALADVSSEDYIHLLQEQLLLLIDVANEDEEFEQVWESFGELVELDDTGSAIRFIIDNLYNLEDVYPGINILKKQVENDPERVDLHINLAALYLIEEENNTSANILHKAQQLTKTPEIQADIDQLLLIANNPDFEMKLGEIVTHIDAKKPLDIEDIEFLETCTQNAQSFIDAYILLAKAHMIDGDNDLALETLLDANKQNPDNPEVIEHLAQLLWVANEQDLAFDYLGKGITANPLYVPLLAITGQFLFELGNYEDAKLYMARAEVISPRDTVLARVRATIANQLGNQ